MVEGEKKDSDEPSEEEKYGDRWTEVKASSKIPLPTSGGADLSRLDGCKQQVKHRSSERQNVRCMSRACQCSFLLTPFVLFQSPSAHNGLMILTIRICVFLFYLMKFLSASWVLVFPSLL